MYEFVRIHDFPEIDVMRMYQESVCKLEKRNDPYLSEVIAYALLVWLGVAKKEDTQKNVKAGAMVLIPAICQGGHYEPDYWPSQGTFKQVREKYWSRVNSVNHSLLDSGFKLKFVPSRTADVYAKKLPGFFLADMDGKSR